MLPTHLAQVRAAVARSCARVGRPVEAVRLVAVSKQQPAEMVAAAARLGQRDFAENYAQEGAAKITRTAEILAEQSGADAPPTAKLTWHFIGGMQSRKCRAIAENFHWAHSIDRLKVARKLNAYRRGAPLNVLLQLNLQRDATAAGVAAEAVGPLAEAVAELPNLRLRGLMTIPLAGQSPKESRATYRRCREVLDELNARGFAMDQLSMGMSGDMDAAIAEGATIVRIGAAIFGARQ